MIQGGIKQYARLELQTLFKSVRRCFQITFTFILLYSKHFQ